MMRLYGCAMAALALTAAPAALAGSAVEAVWISVEIDPSECPALDGFGSADLYLAFDVNPGKPAVTSAPGTGLMIMGGTFYQDPNGDNGPKSEAFFDFFPCARWDSHLTIGESDPFFSPTFSEPNPADWGSALVAEWLPSPGETVALEMDQAKFGDLRQYVRIARITATSGTKAVAGELGVVYFPDSPTVPVTDTVTVPNCAGCWGSADLDGDGSVGSSDLAILLGQWGPCAIACSADLDGNGSVGSGDLAILLGLWG